MTSPIRVKEPLGSLARGYAAGPPLGDGSCPGVTPFVLARKCRAPSARGPHTVPPISSAPGLDCPLRQELSLMFGRRRCWAWFLGVAGTSSLEDGPLEGNHIPLQEYDSTLIDGSPARRHPLPSFCFASGTNCTLRQELSLMFDERRCRIWFLGVAVPARLLAGALEGNWIPLQEYDSAHRDGGPTPCHPSPPLRASIVPSAKNPRSCSVAEYAGLSSRIASCPQLHL